MGCREAGACQGWLDAHPEGADATPGYCRNKERLEALAPHDGGRIGRSLGASAAERHYWLTQGMARTRA
jgi:hypothetical protein